MQILFVAIIFFSTLSPGVAQTYFAEINPSGTVLRVIVATQAFIDTGLVGPPGRWVQSSIDGGLRKNYAGIGYQYDRVRDAFIPQKPYPSWRLNENTARWDAPIPQPGPNFEWNESKQRWEPVAPRGGAQAPK